MTGFIEIPHEVLEKIYTESDRTPSLYFSGNVLLRKFFWMRLYLINSLLCSFAGNREKCLDFGGGSGVLLPTLSELFKEVTLVDLETDQARRISDIYKLANINIVTGDIATVSIENACYDVIVAADVLEHFKHLDVPVLLLSGLLGPGGLLFTSLPTENWVYVLLRKVFGIEKPWDHYHKGSDVEAYLGSKGFVKLRTLAVPFLIKLAPLFLVTAWRYNGK